MITRVFYVLLFSLYYFKYLVGYVSIFLDSIVSFIPNHNKIFKTDFLFTVICMRCFLAKCRCLCICCNSERLWLEMLHLLSLKLI